MKKIHKQLLKEIGIYNIIAYKSHASLNIYRTIKSMLSYGYSFSEIKYDILWSISMIKDFSQYQ